MHTSALQAEYTGTLLHNAQARTAVLDSTGHAVPVLCMDLALDNELHSHMHVEQPFHTAQFSQCQAAAHRLKAGTRVTVQAPLLDLRLVARNATHIHVLSHAIPTPQEQPA